MIIRSWLVFHQQQNIPLSLMPYHRCQLKQTVHHFYKMLKIISIYQSSRIFKPFTSLSKQPSLWNQLSKLSLLLFSNSIFIAWLKIKIHRSCQGIFFAAFHIPKIQYSHTFSRSRLLTPCSKVPAPPFPSSHPLQCHQHSVIIHLHPCIPRFSTYHKPNVHHQRRSYIACCLRTRLKVERTTVFLLITAWFILCKGAKALFLPSPLLCPYPYTSFPSTKLAMASNCAKCRDILNCTQIHKCPPLISRHIHRAMQHKQWNQGCWFLVPQWKYTNHLFKMIFNSFFSCFHYLKFINHLPIFLQRTCTKSYRHNYRSAPNPLRIILFC